MDIFLAAPFTGLLENVGDYEILNRDYQSFIGSILAGLRMAGHSVVCSHEREKWGAEKYLPEDAICTDLRQIDESDVLLAVIGNPPSPGVQMELGYCLAKYKPIVVAHSQSFITLPHLCQGLKFRVHASIFQYTSVLDLLTQAEAVFPKVTAASLIS